VVLVQLATYFSIAFTLLVVRLAEIRRPRRRCIPGEKHNYSWSERFVATLKLVLAMLSSVAAVISGAEALQSFANLSVLAMLPILTYAVDSLLFRLKYAFTPGHPHQVPLRRWFHRVASLCALIGLIVYEDYRLNLEGLGYALASFFLGSVSKTLYDSARKFEAAGIHTWDCPLYVLLWAGIPPCLLVTGLAAWKFEDVHSAFEVTQEWRISDYFFNLAPGVLHHLFHRGFFQWSYPVSAQIHEGSALEDRSDIAATAIKSTLFAGVWVVSISAIMEKNLLDWVQVLAFVILYIVLVGPDRICLYPLKLFKSILRMVRQMEMSPYAASRIWDRPSLRWTTVSIFCFVLSGSLYSWTNIAAYDLDQTNWIGPAMPNIDKSYTPAPHKIVEIVIAHSLGEPTEPILELISALISTPSIRELGPSIVVYTKDYSLNSTMFSAVIAGATTTITPEVLHNIGGETAPFLHHILHTWETLPMHTIFLSASYPRQQAAIQVADRFRNYFVASSVDASGRHHGTGFLNLGEYEPCFCGSCHDSHGWNDSFHLIPSMWGAARPGNTECNMVLLTYGNTFVASVGRIRGMGKDVWQMLYDALMNEDLGNAWIHDKDRLPAKGGLYTEDDSVEKPYFGYTMERLWGILLQCSNEEIAWRCPNILRGWRRAGNRADCGCID